MTINSDNSFSDTIYHATEAYISSRGNILLCNYNSSIEPYNVEGKQIIELNSQETNAIIRLLNKARRISDE